MRFLACDGGTQQRKLLVRQFDMVARLHSLGNGKRAEGGAALIIISALLTLVSGLIPSRVAAKKDPVEALRTE